MDEATIRRELGATKASWKLLYEMGATTAAASRLMNCSQRTALKALKAQASLADAAAAQDVAAGEVARHEIGDGAERTNWPRSFVEMAELIDRVGVENVPAKVRRGAVAGLPRSVDVAE